jgi:hypothetical protein
LVVVFVRTFGDARGPVTGTSPKLADFVRFSRLRAQLHELGAVVGEQLTAEGDWSIDIDLPFSSAQRLARQDGPDGACARDRILTLGQAA